MNTIYEPIDTGIIAETRNSYSARLLTDPQFEEFTSICLILNREIHRSCSFIEKLETYAFAISRTEKGINASRADTIIRDLFKGLFGESMDSLRKTLLKNEEELDNEVIALGHDFALATLLMIEEGELMPFHRAYAHQATLMATELSISDVAAKRIMSEQFEQKAHREFYEEGKQFEDRFYLPQVEAAKRQRGSRNGGARTRGVSSGYSSSNEASSKPTPTNA